MGVTAPQGVKARHFSVRQLVGQHHPQATRTGRPARHDQRHAGQRTRCLQRGAGARVPRQVLQGPLGHRQQLQTALWRQRLRRGEPHQLNRFTQVGLGLLPQWGQRDEEPGVKTFGQARRRQPVAVVGQATQVQPQAVLLAEFNHAHFTSLQAVAPGLQGRQVHVAIGQQQAHLFKRLPHCGHQVVQATLCQPQLRTGRGVVAPQAQGVGQTVTRVEHTARKDRSPTAQIAVAFGAAQHQHLQVALTVFAVAQEQQGSSGARVGCWGVVRVHGSSLPDSAVKTGTVFAPPAPKHRATGQTKTAPRRRRCFELAILGTDRQISGGRCRV